MPPVDLFPLRLAPFEELFYFDDRPEHPATFLCAATLSGPVDSEMLRQAAHDVSLRHPFTRAIVKLDQRDRPWLHRSDAEIDIRVVNKRWESDGFDELAIDLSSEHPCRIWHFQEARQSAVVFQFHHAVFDGLSGFQVFNDWLKIYQSIRCGTRASVDLPRLNPRLLPARCRVQLSWKQRISLLRKQWLSVRGVFRFWSHKAIPLVRHCNPERNSRAGKTHQATVSFALDQVTTRRLRQFASERSVKVNSILARDLFLAISDWQEEKEANQTGTHFRLMIPINERTLRHRGLPACNHCTMIGLDRSREQLRDASQLLTSIQREMDITKQWKLSLNMWRLLSLMRRLPGGIKRHAEQRECRSTCVLTNLGDLSRIIRQSRRQKFEEADRIDVVRFEPVAPIRWGTAAAFCVFYFEKQLHVSMRFDPRQMTPDAASQLANLYESRLTIPGNSK